MTISSRTWHVTAIAIGLGGLAAAAPAHAQSAAPAGSAATATVEISFGPDANPIICPTSQITVATGALAIAVPVGCFAMNQGGYETVWFSKLSITYMTVSPPISG